MRVGSLFSGYGGLDMAVHAVMGGTTAWVSDVCKVRKDGTVGHYSPCQSPCSILAHRYPHVPNLGDITKVDWAAVEPVDIITGGFPCQDVSHGGKRAGLGSGTRTGLWSHMALAIETIRPRFVVAENVRGLLSARADSDMEPCPWCMGDGEGEPPLRALGAVLGDLADIGYDTRWVGLRAADVGAPHGRFRVFILAIDARHGTGSAMPGYERRQPSAGARQSGHVVATDATGQRHERGGRAWDGRPGLADIGVAATDADDARPQGSEPARGRDLSDGRAPADTESDPRGLCDRERGATPDADDRADDGQRARAEPGRGSDATADAYRDGQQGVGRLKPVRRDADRRGSAQTAWGDYEPAIRRWETILGRPAPAPTEESRPPRIPAELKRPVGMRGPLRRHRRLSHYFVEWMQGLPEGHVCDVPGLTRNAALKALGNGVVPQQAEAALRWLLDAQEATA